MKLSEEVLQDIRARDRYSFWLFMFYIFIASVVCVISGEMVLLGIPATIGAIVIVGAWIVLKRSFIKRAKLRASQKNQEE